MVVRHENFRLGRELPTGWDRMVRQGSVPMKDGFQVARVTWILIAVPFGLFAAYISWLIVPVIVQKVVPAVVRAIFGA
jgi:hypothetical protein